MKYKIPIAVCLFVQAEIQAQPVFSQSLSDTSKLVKRLSILNNKVFFNFPAAAVSMPRLADIMAADPNINRETRIFMDKGKMKLVFFAQELYSLSGKNMYNEVTKEDPPNANYKRRLLTDRDSILTVITTPGVFDSTAGGIMINSLLVKTPDNTVMKMDAYINPDAWPLKDEYTKLTEHIFSTISKGNRTVNLEPREESYKMLIGNDKLVFRLPKNYVVNVDEKYDFIVFKLNKYKEITDTSFTSLTIYNGAFPSYFYKEYGLDEKTAVRVKGVFLQNPVDWLTFKDKPSGLYLKEQAVPIDAIEKGMVIHLAMLSTKKEMIDELTRLVENISISR